MKIKSLYISLFILIATSLMAFSIYVLLNNLDSDNVINVTANNNVIVNQLADISARDNSNITSTNLTTSDTNSTSISPNDSKSTAALVVGVTLFVLIVVIGVAIPPISRAIFTANIPENMEMQSMPAGIIN